MIREVIKNMADIGRPRTGKRTAKDKKTATKTLSSQLKQNESWAEKNPCDKITIRLPKGTQDFLKEYVKRKAEENPNSTKYSTFISTPTRNSHQPSVNALVRALLEEELGFSLDTLQEHGND